MRKVKWGVISTAKIGIEKVIPAMQQSELCRNRRDRVARSREGRGGRGSARHSPPTGHTPSCWTTPRSRRSTIRDPMRGMCRVDPGARGRQARACARSRRARRPGSAAADRGARPLRQAVAEAFMCVSTPNGAARASCAGRDDRGSAGDPDVLLLPPDRSRQCAQPTAGRRRALRHRLLRHCHRPLCFRAEPTRVVARSTGTEFKTDRLATLSSSFPADAA